jgi:galactonate dehydratase
MKITEVNAHLHSGTYSDLVFVEVTTEDPTITGWGECTLPGKPYAVAGAVKDAARLVVGMSAENVRSAWEKGYRHGYWRGGAVETSALSAIDIALWDIAGKRSGAPVHAVMGGAVRDSIRTYANLGLSTEPAVLASRAREAVEAGFDLVKFYPLPPMIALPPASLASRVHDCCAAVREAIGPGRDFALDFHGRPLPHAVISIERAIRDLNPLWIEEPVQVEDESALLEVRRKFSTPIALGERMFTRWQFRRVLEAQLCDIIQPDVGNAGGLSELRVIAEMAEAHSVVFSPHSPNGLLHTAASIHASAIAQNFGVLEYRPSADAASGLFIGSEHLEGGPGSFRLPTANGLGLAVDAEQCRFDPSRIPILGEVAADGTALDW